MVKKIGIVSHVETTLENGQVSVRNRALFRNVKDRVWVDSTYAGKIKVCFYKSEEDIGFRGLSLRSEKNFFILVQVEELPSLPDEFVIKTGDVIAMLRRGEGAEFEISKILKGGFVKSGNEVYLLSFENSH